MSIDSSNTHTVSKVSDINLQRSSTAAASLYSVRSSGFTLPRLPSVSSISINPRRTKDLTPTTIEACRRCGLKPKALLPCFRPTSPENINAPSNILQLRKTFAEKNRLLALKQVDEIRTKLIKNEGRITAKDVKKRRIERRKRMMRTITARRPLIPSSSTIFSSNRNSNSSTLGTNEMLAHTDIYFLKRQRLKTAKINHLIINKWKFEAANTSKKIELKNMNQMQTRNNVHNTFIQRMRAKSHAKNMKIDERSKIARKNIKEEIQRKKNRVLEQMQINKNNLKISQNLEKQRVEKYINEQKYRYNEHQKNFKNVENKKFKYYTNLQNKNLVRHQNAIRNLNKKRDLKSKERRTKSVQTHMKIKHSLDKKQQMYDKKMKQLMDNIHNLDMKMKDVVQQKNEFRIALNKKSQMNRNRFGNVKKQIENERIAQKEKLLSKEKETNLRLKLYKKQLREEFLLKKEYAQLKEVQRLKYKQRMLAKDRYGRKLLEEKLKMRDERISLKKDVKNYMQNEQKKFNSNIRLLRNELQYKFDHCTEAEITNNKFMSKFEKHFQSIEQ